MVTIGESLGLIGAASPEGIELTTRLRLGIGGAESNVAIGLSRLGIATSWIGRVGDDDLGRRIVRELRAEGVRAEPVVDPEALTALMLKEARAVGATRVRYYRTGQAGSRIGPDDLDPSWIASAQFLHLTGITASLSPTAEATVARALDIAEENRLTVSFDVNHRSTITRHRDAGSLYRSIARRASIVFAGEDEARLLVADADDRESLVRGIAALGAREVVLKLGEEGCLALIDDELSSMPAFAVDVVDTVGAGDAFVAGYLAERVRGASVDDRLRTAVQCGAYACASSGDWEGAPRRADLEAMVSGNDPVQR